MGALNFFAFRPLGEEVIKLQMTIIKFIYLLVTIIHCFLCRANTARCLANISLTTSLPFLLALFLKRL